MHEIGRFFAYFVKRPSECQIFAKVCLFHELYTENDVHFMNWLITSNLRNMTQY